MDYSLVCVPFAGGGAGFYRAWKQLPSAAPRIVPIQLPGREERFVDEPFRDAVEAAAALAPLVVEATRGGGPVALFGHSLGAVLAYELARRLEQDEACDLRHLFVSGSPGPWTGRTDRATGLDDEEFLARVQEFAGYQHEALADPDMRELLLPMLRADVEMHENYKPVSDEPLRIPVTSLRGADDTLVSAEQAGEWRSATGGPFRYVEMPGGHMYLVDSPLPLLEAVVRAVQE
ncbi:thioesterase [Streptomyces sp. M2CJ-2]|uniref:thioesterase II family protein n=1 Tax=Streptomyces sp. M2CJ-2 TaxID=2803948 RepID=UPI001926FE38|nr:alpha/beta fold hydrolase [Streptomyces sp. M2CJ-2]MBL3669469.1 thioesterase [Streptomyces sp. M2CJ-2]